jgi:catechol-2,3-dioxygenase
VSEIYRIEEADFSAPRRSVDFLSISRSWTHSQEATLTAGGGKEITMRVLGYTWAGVRAADLKSAARFFADVVGFSLIHEGKGLVQFEVPSGQLFEVFGSESRYY